MHELVEEALSLNRQLKLALHESMLRSLLAKHDNWGMVGLALEHPLNLSLLDSIPVIFVVLLDFLLKVCQDLLDFSEKLL